MLKIGGYDLSLNVDNDQNVKKVSLANVDDDEVSTSQAELFAVFDGSLLHLCQVAVSW